MPLRTSLAWADPSFGAFRARARLRSRFSPRAPQHRPTPQILPRDWLQMGLAGRAGKVAPVRPMITDGCCRGLVRMLSAAAPTIALAGSTRCPSGGVPRGRTTPASTGTTVWRRARVAARGCGSGAQGRTVEPAAGGPRAAGYRLLTDEPDTAPTDAIVRGVQVRCRPDRRSPRPVVGTAAAQTVPPRRRADRGRHSGPRPRPPGRRAVGDISCRW